MATSSGILAWKILCTEESGTLESMGSQRVGHAKSWVPVRERALARARAHTHTHTAKKVYKFKSARAHTHTHTAKVVYKFKRFFFIADGRASRIACLAPQPNLISPHPSFSLFLTTPTTGS